MKYEIDHRLKGECPECIGGDLILRDSKYGLFYGCEHFPACRGKHGAHKETGEPFGKPADKETREWRIRAHSSFDKLWKSGKVKRKKAYSILSELMGMKEGKAHIGSFNIEQCKKLIKKLKDYD